MAEEAPRTPTSSSSSTASSSPSSGGLAPLTPASERSISRGCSKLYFRHGPVGCAKTLNLLAVAHNYEQQGKVVMVLKPACDTRFGAARVESRAGVSRDADLLLDNDTRLDTRFFRDCDCVLVDEAQFLSAAVVDQLRELTHTCGVPVICYGLRTDFKTRLFEGSKRLLELADAIEEVKTTCNYCNKKGVLNLKLVDGEATDSGAQVELGCEELYKSVCYSHYAAMIEASSSAGCCPADSP